MNRTLLYIEDDASTIVLVERLLKFRPEIGLHVATNAHDGVKAAIDIQPTFILLDNRLPDGTGREVLGQLASSEATAGSLSLLSVATQPGPAMNSSRPAHRNFSGSRSTFSNSWP